MLGVALDAHQEKDKHNGARPRRGVSLSRDKEGGADTTRNVETRTRDAQ